ncbi:hypothetical protein [Novosphingobium gossypii]|uniref:hypothetical protein n=1 Tax=Novosphingobium gossypii TaxID=1604774 RepID=UPI003D1D4023
MTATKDTKAKSDDKELANKDNLTPATDVAASGAIVEPEILEGIDTSHPAVDANPRAEVPKQSNQIDFNDPTISQEEAVERNLKGDD